MPFSILDIKERRSAEVVAVLMSGGGDGSCIVEDPVVLRVGRSGGSLGYSVGVGGRHYEPGNDGRSIGPLRVSWTDRTSPNFVDGTGKVQGIAVLGLVARGETHEAALARLAPETPDVVALWAVHCQAEMENAQAMRSALEDRARDGFGTGLPVVRR